MVPTGKQGYFLTFHFVWEAFVSTFFQYEWKGKNSQSISGILLSRIPGKLK